MNIAALNTPAELSLDRVRGALCPQSVRDAMVRAGIAPPGARRVAVERVHLSGRRPAVIHYRLDRGDGTAPALVFGEGIGAAAPAHAAQEIERLAKSRRRQLSRNGQGAICPDPVTGLVFRLPGLDAKLPGLRLLHDVDFAAGTLASLPGVHVDPARLRVTLCAHRLGKRAVLRIDLGAVDGARTLFARLRPTASQAGLYAHRRHEAIAAALASRGGVEVPQSRGYVEDLGAGFYTALEGRPLSFDEPCDRDALRAALAALSAFHESAIDLPRHHDAEDEIALLADRVVQTRTLVPGLGDLAERAFERVEARFAGLSGADARPCHRDFHEGQVLVGEGTAGILDFDTACMADPALDIGNLAAHVRLASMLGGKPLHALEQGARDGFPGCGTHPPGRDIDIWARATLLRLACLHAPTSTDPSITRALFQASMS